MIRGGGLVLLLVDKLLQSRFLLGAALEDQHDSAERRGIGQGALVELGAGQRVSIPGKCRDPRLIDGLKDAGAGGGKLRLRGPRGGGEECSDSRQGGQQCSRDPRH